MSPPGRRAHLPRSGRSPTRGAQLLFRLVAVAYERRSGCVNRNEAEKQGQSADELRDKGGRAYDSAERRETMAGGLDPVENRAAVDARVQSDVAQGRPATDATAHAPGRAPKARKTQAGPQTPRTVQRAGRSR